MQLYTYEEDNPMPIVSIIVPKEDGSTCNDEEKSFEVEENGVIYDELEAQGHKLPHGCLSGSCGTCRVLVIEGQENLKEPSFIEKDTLHSICESYRKEKGEDFLKGKTIRLSCRARVIGDIKICPLKK